MARHEHEFVPGRWIKALGQWVLVKASILSNPESFRTGWICGRCGEQGYEIPA